MCVCGFVLVVFVRVCLRFACVALCFCVFGGDVSAGRGDLGVLAGGDLLGLGADLGNRGVLADVLGTEDLVLGAQGDKLRGLGGGGGCGLGRLGGLQLGNFIFKGSDPVIFAHKGSKNSSGVHFDKIS